VCIKSTSLRGSALSALKLADADKNKVADLSLVVYRNAQGVFMPAISSSDEPCYWRLQPVGKPEASRHGDRHRHGDTLRLTWSFADQAGAGFRDYLDDIYGRRCFGRPADLPSSAGDTLCLKLPFPRPEGPDSRGIGLFSRQTGAAFLSRREGARGQRDASCPGLGPFLTLRSC